MMKPWDIIKELESDNSRLKKEAIIRRESDANNIRFFNGVGACLDGFRTFGIQKVPESKKDGPGLTQEQPCTSLGRARRQRNQQDEERLTNIERMLV